MLITYTCNPDLCVCVCVCVHVYVYVHVHVHCLCLRVGFGAVFAFGVRATVSRVSVGTSVKVGLLQGEFGCKFDCECERKCCRSCEA